MTKKATSSFVCQQCGYESVRWFGKCPECDNWNSAVETVVDPKRVGKSSGKVASNKRSLVSLDSVSSKLVGRTRTKISELDRVLGGGLVSGQVVLIAGEPGIGKSTLLLQVADSVVSDKDSGVVIYASGEESSSQIKVRSDRLGINGKNILLLETTDIDEIIEERQNPKLLIVDSIQTMQTGDLLGMAGSVGQVRECAYRIVRFAKSSGTPVFIVGHVTKDGSVAGPNVLMHIVDTVLWFEGDRGKIYRFLRSVKNRFGSTEEVGIFSMEEKGLKPIDVPEKIFLTDFEEGSVGTVITSVLQGNRPLLVEIQSLVVPTKLMMPKRVVQGIDQKRFELMLAILTRRVGFPLYEYDVFVNVAGGMSIKNDPSADLAVCLSIASSFLDKAISSKTVAIGEVDLLGDIRQVVAMERRIKEARRLGFKQIISPPAYNNLRKTIDALLR
jgi:DNA repair protein RadA/Sms